MSQTAAVRTVIVCRPPLEQDARFENQGYITINNNTTAPEILLPSSQAGKNEVLTPNRIFGYQATPLPELCSSEVEPLLQGVLSGESASIIAFGQTSSGKSYTMGTEAISDAASKYPNSVSVYTARRLFELARKKDIIDFNVFIAMVEVYREGNQKEQMFDLLQGFSRPKVSRISDDSSIWQPVVGGEQDLLDKIYDGAQIRNTDRTDGNLRSSRSHAVIMIRVQHRKRGSNGRLQLFTGRLILADLAGSERATAASDGSVTRKQGAGINVGLLFLGKVIEEVSQTGKSLNFRNSELTRILKPALSGSSQSGCRTLMIGCISPCLAHIDRTRDTIHYMHRAGMISNMVAKNVESLDSKREDALRSERDDLKQRCEALAGQVLSLEQQLQQSLNITTGNNNTSSILDGGEAGVAIDQSSVEKEVVVLSIEEHRTLLLDLQAARDRGDSLEVLLKHADRKNAELSEEIEALEAAALVSSTKTPLVDVDTKTPSSSTTSSIPRLSLPPLPPTSARTTMTPATIRPSPRTTPRVPVGAASLAAASPVLAAAREMDPLSVISSSSIASLLRQQESVMTAEEICLADDSNLEPEALDVLLQLTRNKLETGTNKQEKMAGERESAEVRDMSKDDLLRALRCRGLENALLQLAVRSYNSCLGSIQEQLSVAEEKLEDLKGVEAQLHQAAVEKVNYVRMTAAYAEALDITQAQLKEFDQSASPPPSNTSGGFFSRLRTSLQHTGGHNPHTLSSPSRSPIASPSKQQQQPRASTSPASPSQTPAPSTSALEDTNNADQSLQPLALTPANSTSSLSVAAAVVEAQDTSRVNSVNTTRAASLDPTTTPVLSGFPLTPEDFDNEDDEEEDGGLEEFPAVPTLPAEIDPARAAEQQEIRKFMQGPIDTSAINAESRLKGEQKAEFLSRNPHWQAVPAQREAVKDKEESFGWGRSLKSKKSKKKK